MSSKGAKKAAPVKKAAPAKKAAPVKKAAPAKKAAPVKKAAPAKKAAPVKKAAPAKKAVPAKKAAPVKKAAPAKKRSLVVREDESPWTAAEISDVREQLLAHGVALETEIEATEADIADLVADSGDGAGDDQADAGTKTFEREHEMSLANNVRAMLQQVRHALNRIDDGTYGICETCAKPIGKYRLQAFPRATMCVACKQAEERRFA